VTEGTVLAIYISMTDESDFDWIRNKTVPVVEETVEEQGERLDGEASVTWAQLDDEPMG
jgi:hypothetical protein